MNILDPYLLTVNYTLNAQLGMILCVQSYDNFLLIPVQLSNFKEIYYSLR